VRNQINLEKIADVHLNTKVTKIICDDFIHN